MVQQFQHMLDVLRVLDHEVELHVELAANELQQTTETSVRFK